MCRMAGELGRAESALPRLELDQRTRSGHTPGPIRLDGRTLLVIETVDTRDFRARGSVETFAAGRVASPRVLRLAAPVHRLIGQPSPAGLARRLPDRHVALARSREPCRRSEGLAGTLGARGVEAVRHRWGESGAGTQLSLVLVRTVLAGADLAGGGRPQSGARSPRPTSARR